MRARGAIAPIPLALVLVAPAASFASACVRDRSSAPLVVAVASAPPAPIVSSAPVPTAPSAPDAGPPPIGWVRASQNMEKVGRDAALDAVRAAPSRVVLRALHATADCSSIGGDHAFFGIDPSADGSAGRRAYLGGRGFHLPPGLLEHRAADADAQLFAGGAVDGWFVGGIELLPARETAPPGPCIKGTFYDAQVKVLVPVVDRGEAVRLLRTLGR